MAMIRWHAGRGQAETRAALASTVFAAAVLACTALAAGFGAVAPASAAATGSAATAGPAGARPAASAGELWTARFLGEHGNTVPSTVKVSPDGGTVYVTGGSQPVIGTYDFATVAYDAADGAPKWTSYYAGPGPGGFLAEGLVVSPDGGTVYVTGPSGGSGTGLDYATVAYDASTGAQLWASRYNGPGNGGDGSSSLAISKDGSTLYVTGGSQGSGTANDYATIAYDASTGAQQWVSRYNGPGNGNDYALGVVVSQAGTRVYVTGGSAGAHSNFDYATIAYTSGGAQLWVRRYNGTSDAKDYAHGLVLTPDGRTVIVTGATRDRGHGVDYGTIAYSAATGATRWVRTYNGPANNTDDAVAIAIGAGGRRVYVTGHSSAPATNQDYTTIAYSAATGARLWLSRHNGSASKDDEATALAVGPGGKTVYVTGFSLRAGGSGYRYATVGYAAATGKQLWVQTYGSQASLAQAVAAGPGGHTVFVTGASQGSGGYNYVTIGYHD
jgi:DNA-binding beta-propeller fold protein YncE